ncbi:MAG: hypothetical protein KDJ16_06675 [Hyphomicrobiales bacterium]|nr:hypothetical protein [Rhodoblastus sp.]MCC2111700.1 hypothetical protein [Hyphomicrobiales bacterium]
MNDDRLRAGRARNDERGLTVAGVLLAGAIATFAAVAVERNDGVPRIHGVEHMALFARPTRALDERVGSFGVGGRTIVAVPHGDRSPDPIDYSPTATIQPDRRQPSLKEVFRDRVIIEGAAGRIEVRPGEVAEGFGELQEIRRIRGQWRAVFIATTDSGHSSR